MLNFIVENILMFISSIYVILGYYIKDGYLKDAGFIINSILLFYKVTTGKFLFTVLEKEVKICIDKMKSNLNNCSMLFV